ncbi:MAG TPA: hypothetical protein VGQ52_05085 [Gemmatimonadaceae bacterium]|jgi:hypothetical protein|nr:hypothetical protein [Gemmatimonadaceae bacterium]
MSAITRSAWPTVPRVLGAVYALFIALFALDVLSAGADFLTTAGAFAIHLIPAAFLLGVLLIAWHRELLGGLLYLALGVGYLLATGGRMDPVTYIVISGTLLVLGGLFLVSWFLHRGKAQEAES